MIVRLTEMVGLTNYDDESSTKRLSIVFNPIKKEETYASPVDFFNTLIF